MSETRDKMCVPAGWGPCDRREALRSGRFFPRGHGGVGDLAGHLPPRGDGLGVWVLYGSHSLSSLSFSSGALWLCPTRLSGGAGGDLAEDS